MAIAERAMQLDRTQPLSNEILNLDAFESTSLQSDPFDHLYVEGLIRPEALAGINEDYPQISKPGNFSPEEVEYGPEFADMLAQIQGPAFTEIVGSKFDVDLSDCEPRVAIRRYVEATDGNIHTDHPSKVVTMLIYFNPFWEHEGGRLRMLRSLDDMEDYAMEVVPAAGNMIAFRRTDNSYHGHKPHVGERRFIQIMWTRGGGVSRTVTRLTKPIRRLLNRS